MLLKEINDKTAQLFKNMLRLIAEKESLMVDDSDENDYYSDVVFYFYDLKLVENIKKQERVNFIKQ